MIEISDGQNTIVKHRFVDIDSSARLFETYEFDPLSYNSIVMERLNDKILEKESELDLLIIADYGHGLISKDFSSKLSKNKLFKAVNTQANAGNRGYNTITKYESADMISLNGAELQLELRERNPDYLKIVPVYMSKLQAKYAILTLGADGLMVFDRNGEVAQVPALAQKVIDKVGAGDSVLAMASLLAKLGAPPAIIGFVSSVVAAHEVSQLGHQSSLSLVDIRKAVKGVLG
jgi:bifunctional ADP-heptose synthase (sugar kinase/adenylyltransferase)